MTATRLSRPILRCALFCYALFIWANISLAAVYPLPPEGASVIGELQASAVRQGETLLDIARRHDLGYEEIMAANPGLDPWLPAVGARVLLPTQYILPDGPREGIVVNLPELRLYYYPPAQAGKPREVITYPVGIGAEGKSIPLATTKIIEKKEQPSWVVPESILAEHAAEGEILPRVVPPGPDNPLGDFALRLGLPSYLIHGTNRPFSVGMRVSHGCLRMYPEDIKTLFPLVAMNSTVRIVDQPYKAGWHNNILYLEAHHPLVENNPNPLNNTTPVVRVVAASSSEYLHDAAWQAAKLVASHHNGMPSPIFGRGQATLAGTNTLPPQAPKVSATHPWLVQVGVFQDPRSVARVAQMMRRLDLPVMASASDAHCRLLVGPFASREEAMNSGARIKQDAGIENFLVPAARVNTNAGCDLN